MTNLGFSNGSTYVPPRTSAVAPSAQESGQFNSLMGSGNWAGAADYARSLGYKDQDIANYVGAHNYSNGAGGTIGTQEAANYLAGSQKPQMPQLPQFYQNNAGMSAPSLDEYKKNPYLDQMAAGITQQMNDNWTRNLAPSIRSGAMAAGGFGGSRQGVVEANALNDMNRSLGQNLTSLYGQDYTNAMNRNLQKYGMDQSYNLGMANNNLGFANLDSNNAQFGANLGLSTLNAQNNWANQNALTANQIAQTPINYFNTFSNNANQIAGQGGTSSQTNQGNPYMGALGGAITGYKLFGAK